MTTTPPTPATAKPATAAPSAPTPTAPEPHTMHAIRLHTHGPAENLRHERTETPRPAPGQVRIAVEAAGVHLIDTALREGLPGPYPAPPLPTIPGREVAGTVDALGESTDPSWLGRRVVAHFGMPTAPGATPPAGGYAQYAVTEAAKLHALPDHLGAAEAVAMVGTGRTTLGILQFADAGPGTVAVVPAAAGGIGTLLVQYLKHAGATVVGLAGGPGKTGRVRANGADLAVDYRRDDWEREVRAFLGDRPATVVFDSVGGDIGRAAVGLLGKGGRHLVFGWSSGGLRDGGPLTFTDEELSARGITSESVLGPPMLQKAGGDLRVLETRALDAAASGLLRPTVQRYPLAQAAAAHHDLETRATVGKVVLEPGE